MNLSERLDAARALALNGGVPMRRTDGALYALLGECLSICEEVERDGLHGQLREAIRKDSKGKGRRYVEKNTDVYILVCRHVLEGNDNRNSFYRYAVALRSAASKQISGNLLPAWLHENGGVVQLERSKPVKVRNHMRNNFHLRNPVLVPGHEPFTLTLQLTPLGDFVVLS